MRDSRINRWIAPGWAIVALICVMGAPVLGQQTSATAGPDYTRISGWSTQVAQNDGAIYDLYRPEPIRLNELATLSPQDTQRRSNEPGGNAVPQDGRVTTRSQADTPYDNRITTRGTVSSVSRSSMVVRTDNGRYVVFSFDRYAQRPQTIAVGSRVRVVSRAADDGVQVASFVAEDAGGPDSNDSFGANTGGANDPVPDDVRRLERQITRQARRFRAGVRAGAGLDPEIITAGVHSTMGPFFSDDIWFRPNAEFGFGEVTTMFALNLEAIYRLPVNSRQSQWLVYAGAGPGFNFISRNFEDAQKGDRDIDFSELDFEAGLNFLVGVERRSGMFLEFKAAAYSSPAVRFLVGYSF